MVMNIETFSADNNRFYVRLLKPDGTTDVIFDGELEPSSELATRRPFRVNNNIRATGQLYLGFPSREISNKKGYILPSSLDSAFASSGDVLMYDGERWAPNNLTGNTILSSDFCNIESSIIKFNEIGFKCSPLELGCEEVINSPLNYMQWAFSTPSNFFRNELSLNIYYINKNSNSSDIKFKIAAVDVMSASFKFENIEWTNINRCLYNDVGSLDNIRLRVQSNESHVGNKLIVLFIKRSNVDHRYKELEGPLNIHNINVEYNIV